MAKQAKVSRREYWRDVIERHQAGGLSIQRFCRREHLATATFFEWKRKLRQERGAPESSASGAVNFASVRVVPEAPAATPTGTLEIVLPGDRRVRLSGRVDRATLADVLAVLEG